MARNCKVASSPEASPSIPSNTIRRVAHYKFREEDLLGKGLYGTVYFAYNERRLDQAGTPAADLDSSNRGQFSMPHSNRVVALKEICSSKSQDGLAAATLREIAILRELLRHLRPEQGSPVPTLTQAKYTAYCPSSELESSSMTRHLTKEEEGRGDVEDPNRLLVFSHSYSEPGTCSSGWSLHSLPTSIYSDQEKRFEDRLFELLQEGRKYIVDLYDVIVEPSSSKVYIALEYCEGGDMWHYLRHAPERRIRDRSVFKRWVTEMLLGLAFIHSKHISHRDLKPQNIMLRRRNAASSNGSGLLGDAFSLKIADFGLSRVEGIPVKKYVHEAITLWYRSPDVLLGNTNYGYSADAWSLGCIILEVASGGAPFCGKDESDQLQRIFLSLGGLTLSNFPDMYKYPRTPTYKEMLTFFMQNTEREMQSDLFQYHRDAEMMALLKNGGSDSAHLSTYASLCYIASSKVRVRAFLEKRGCGMDVLDEDGLDLVARLLLFDPVRRLKVLDAIHHPFFGFNLSPVSSSTFRENNSEAKTRSGGEAPTGVGGDEDASCLESSQDGEGPGAGACDVDVLTNFASSGMDNNLDGIRGFTGGGASNSRGAWIGGTRHVPGELRGHSSTSVGLNTSGARNDRSTRTLSFLPTLRPGNV